MLYLPMCVYLSKVCWYTTEQGTLVPTTTNSLISIYSRVAYKKGWCVSTCKAGLYLHVRLVCSYI